MSKKTPKVADAAVDASAPVAAAAEPKAKVVGVRGPKGVALTAKITILAAGNPKRAGTRSHAEFAQYVDGMTVQAFLDAVGERATAHIVYDTKHGFIAVEGYNVEVLPPKAPRVAKEKVAKAPKAPKAPKEKLAPVAKDEALDRETEETEA